MVDDPTIQRRPPSPWILLCVTVLIGANASAQSRAVAEYKLKAAFLYNFSKYIEWPQTVLAKPEDAFVFGFVGDHQFVGVLNLFDGKMAQGHAVRVTSGARLDELGSPQILFIGLSDPAAQRETLNSLTGKPVLTVGESTTFLDDGGIINFVLEGDKIRFEINADAARRANLKIGSELMALAKRIMR